MENQWIQHGVEGRSADHLMIGAKSADGKTGDYLHQLMSHMVKIDSEPQTMDLRIG